MMPQIAAYRLKNKLSQTALAAAVGVSTRTLYNWETKGDNPGPNADQLCRLAEVLHTDPETLLDWDNAARNNLENLSADEEALVAGYRALEDKYKVLVQTIVETLPHSPTVDEG